MGLGRDGKAYVHQNQRAIAHGTRVELEIGLGAMKE